MERSVLLFLKLLLIGHVVQSAKIVARVDPLVLTSQGLVRGARSTDGDFSSFLGIPYARVNASNPFGAALPAPVFEDVFNAYDGQVACPQASGLSNADTTSLDCLRLNIYVPNHADSRNPLPVLVWIHGGSYVAGKAGEYRPWFLVRQDIVLVTINYRLGPYGFMCLNTPEVPGNQGLKDQVAALRWLRQNIAAFGGNPYRITLAGQNAGSSSVNLHLYSPHERLFQQAIMQSGIMVPLLAPSNDQAAIQLAGYLGYQAQNTESAIEFLSNTPHELVSAATIDAGFRFSPCIERTVGPDNFMTTNPLVAQFPRKTNNMPIILGVTSMERYGLGAIGSFREGLKIRLDLNEEELSKLTDIVQHFYADDTTDSLAISSYLEDFGNDIMIYYENERETRKLLEQGAGPIYNYVFDYVSESDRDELKYLFAKDVNGSYGSLNEEEQQISDSISTLWANFVKEGNPTPTSSAVSWPAVSNGERPYLRIGMQAQVENRFKHGSISFWELFYDSYGDRRRLLQF